MKPADFDVQKVIDYLQGTCNSIDSAVNELYPDMNFEDLSGSDFNCIDNQIFECQTCNWWCEMSELAQDQDENICEDCHEADN